MIDLESGTVDGIGELVFDEFGTLVDVLFAESRAVYSDNLFEYGHDTLIGGHGKDTLVGDLGTLDVAAKSGIVLEDSYYAASSALLTKNSFIMGNDTLIGEHGNDKLISDIEYLNLTLEAGAVFDAGIPTFGVPTFSNVQSGPRDENDNIYQMGDDILKGGKGHDLMAGDFDMINITAIAEVAGGIIPVTNVFLTDRYLSGDDVLEGSKGRDEMYGDGINVTLNLTPGESLPGSVQAQSNVHVGITYEYGDDIMKGGKGHDLMVGDLGVYQVLVNPGNAEGDAPRVSVSSAFSSVDVFGNSDEDQNQHLYGNDIMDGEKGDDKMVGDVITFDLDLQASTSLGANAFVVFDWGGQFGTTDAYATFGDDIMNGGKGDNEMIGDVENMCINGESNICSAFCFSRYEDTHIDYGNDTLIADMGNDKIYGDIKNLEVIAQGGTCALVEDRSDAFCSAIFSRNTWDFGVDIIDSGKGHEIVVGDLDELNLNGLGGEALGIQCGAIGSMQGMSFTCGNDVISSLGGNNMLTGDVAKMTYNAVGNIVASAGSQSAGALLLNQFVFGNDVIEGGVNQDYIWGDTQTMSFNLLSDQAIGLNEFAPPPFGSAISEGDIAGNLYINGDDQILGRGGYDLIYGDVERLEIASTAGEAMDGAFSRTVFVGNQFIFGEDIIDAGRGNDIIFADLDVLDIDLAAGLATGGVGLTALWGSIATMQSNAFVFGNDQVAGGDGHDFIVGDLGSFNFMTDTVDGNDNSLVVADSNLIVLGNDFLDGGADNDVIYGDIIDATDLQAFLDYDVFNEILLPGAPVTIPTGPLGNNMDPRWG